MDQLIEKKTLNESTKQTKNQNLTLIFFLLPGFVLLVLLAAWPVMQSIWSSFAVTHVHPTDAQYAGLAHYQTLLSQKAFWNSLWLAFKFTSVTTLIELWIALTVALFLYFQKSLPRIIEILLILPMFILPVVSGLAFRYIYDPNDGPLSYLFDAWGMEPKAPLADPSWAFWSIVLQDIWRMWPFLFLILYAGLKALPHSTQDAARIDGANTRQVIAYILLPALKPTIGIACGLKIMESLKVFTEVYVMTGGGPGDSTSILSLYIVKQAFHFFQVGPASAASVLLLILGITLAWTITRLQSRSPTTSGASLP
jgi:multiple sugar transport system permease protein